MGQAQIARMTELAGLELLAAERRSNGERRAPVLPALVVNALNARAAFTAANDKPDCTDAEWNRAELAAFDARAELRAALMCMGLTKAMIDQLGDVL